MQSHSWKLTVVRLVNIFLPLSELEPRNYFYKSSPLDSVLTYSNYVHTPKFPKIHFNIILTSVSNSPKRSISNKFSHQASLCISCLSSVCRIYIYIYINCETTFCEAYSPAPLSFSHLIPNITSTPCFQTPLMYALAWTWETKFHTHIPQESKLKEYEKVKA